MHPEERSGIARPSADLAGLRVTLMGLGVHGGGVSRGPWRTPGERATS